MLRRQQSGFVLLLIVLIMIGVGGAIVLTTLGTAALSSERALVVQSSNSDRLREARAALIGYAIGRVGSSSRPGMLPVPDTLNNSNYDGTADTFSCLDGSAPNGQPALVNAATSSANLRCLGRLPWKTLGMQVDSADEIDPTGRMPWYAVSENLANLVFCMQVLNPSTAAGATTSFACNALGPAWPWLKVCDETGRVVSDRVAVVLIMPGAPITTQGRIQSRSGSPRPQPSQYLDAIPTPPGWASLSATQRCTAYDNAGLTGEFVSAPLSANFNDQLIYITIDELMAELESRVATQVREAFVTYRAAYGSYPWMAPVSNLSTGVDATIAVPPNSSGLVPFYTPSASGQKFKTELAWSIPGGSDTIASGSTSPVFTCFGGVLQCRLRQAGYTAIPGTLTASNFTALKTASVSTPSVSCLRNDDKTLFCDDYSYVASTTLVSYYVQWRFCCGSGTYANLGGPYSGTQSRTVVFSTATGLSASGAASYTAANATDPVRRGFSTSTGFALFGTLAATDYWSPDSAGTPPFDMSTPAITGSGSTGGTGKVTVSKIRVYPDLPQWYYTEKWYEYIYAALSTDVTPTGGLANCASNCLTAGNRSGVDFVTISTGAALAGQMRYSGTPGVSAFLEPPNDAWATTKTFAAPNQTITGTYADSVITFPR